MKEIKNTQCKHFLDQVCDELAESIDTPLCQEMKEHLEHCTECCISLESMRLTVHLFRQLYDENVPERIDTNLWIKLGLKKSGS